MLWIRSGLVSGACVKMLTFGTESFAYFVFNHRLIIIAACASFD